MTALQGAVEPAAPVSKLHQTRSFDVADFPAPSGREEEWPWAPPRAGLRPGRRGQAMPQQRMRTRP
jgi:hypothetical protein